MPIPNKLIPIVVYYADKELHNMMRPQGGKTEMDIMKEVYQFVSAEIAPTQHLRERYLNHREQLILANLKTGELKIYSPHVEGIDMNVLVQSGGNLEAEVASAFQDCRGVIVAANSSSQPEIFKLLAQYDPQQLYKDA